MAIDPRMLDEAASWAVRTGDAAFADWAGFTEWLERDAGHAEAYDRVMGAIEGVVEVAGAEPSAIPGADIALEPHVKRGPFRAWIGGAIAAVLVLAAVLGLQLRGGGVDYVTAPGETRSVALADGSRITLAGGTRLAMTSTRAVRLDQGQALFEVRHDAARPFVVVAGEATLVDVGTVFDVRRELDATVVGVSEGAVVFNPKRQNLRVDPGEQASLRNGSDRIVRSVVPVSAIGEWREGRLTFRDASLADVAAGLTRATGIDFTARPGGSRRVSGSVVVAPLRSDPAALGPLLGVTMTRSADGWTIEP
ncbi:FecR domain-containing protein [Novosphingobium aquiterrae]|uniref:FecR domain-containing protein n=1 Tax=Novosphingobium aquiterrae TaxID=624388 RepID=A0ABV6PIR0_9SPHN